MSEHNPSLIEIARACKEASKVIADLSTGVKNQALEAMADALLAQRDLVIGKNALDITDAKKKGLSPAMIDRLILDDQRLEKMAAAVREVATLKDPVGGIGPTQTRPSGIQVAQMQIPLGVIAIIYESRPNVTSDAAALCLKAGNAVILRGGSEAFHSNQAIIDVLHAALDSLEIPREIISFVPTTDRAVLNELLTLTEQIDLIIPRGGEGLIRFVAENSRIPVIKHYKGVCHQYVDATADVRMAVDLVIDGKTSRPGVCNALETLLVHRDIAALFLPEAANYLAKSGVELRGCLETRKILPDIREATEEDYAAEYLDLILAIKIVDSMDEAIEHIQRFGSDHTEVIVTNDLNNSRRFLQRVNSSVVLVNASSRFSDGGELGLGAEIGISTTKLHAFGPMGLDALTTKKFVVQGSGETRHNIAYRSE